MEPLTIQCMEIPGDTLEIRDSSFPQHNDYACVITVRRQGSPNHDIILSPATADKLEQWLNKWLVTDVGL